MRMHLAVTVGAAALLMPAFGPQPAWAGRTLDDEGPAQRTAQVITYSIEPDDAAPTISLIRPNGADRREISWPVDGAVISRISPDGRHIVAATFVSEGAVRPAVSRLDGSHFKRLAVASLPSDADVGPCIWATARALLCEVRSSAGTVDGIYRVDARDRRPPVRLTVTPFPPGDDFGGGDIPGDVSPDGEHFVFVRSIPFPPADNPDATQSGALFIGNTAGTGAHRITRWGLPNSHDTGFESWGSHGRGIVFGTEAGGIARISADGRHLRHLALDIPADSYAYGPTWAPTGNRIAFGLYPAPDYQSDIYVADVRTGHLRQLTSTPEVDDAPDWELLGSPR
jgi:Tol biopolymer transport system component